MSVIYLFINFRTINLYKIILFSLKQGLARKYSELYTFPPTLTAALKRLCEG